MFAAMMLLASTYGSQSPDRVVVQVREPIAPAQFYDTLNVRCEGKNLRIENLGFRIPEVVRPAVTVDGKVVTGGGYAALIDDLSSRSAVYRFGVGCQPGRGFVLYIYTAERQPGERVGYRMSRALIYGGVVVEYQPARHVSYDTFWFR